MSPASSSRLVSLGLCVLVLFHGSLAQLTGQRQQSSRRLSGRSECQIDQITAREPNRRQVSEAGFSEFWDSGENDELECAGVQVVRHTINPKGLLLPYYPSTHELVYVVRGEGLQGTVLPGCPETFETSFPSDGTRQQFTDRHQRVYRYKEGDILALPAGAVHWTYNDGDTPIVVVVLRDTSNVANQLDRNFRKFFLAGNRNGQVSEGGYEPSQQQQPGSGRHRDQGKEQQPSRGRQQEPGWGGREGRDHPREQQKQPGSGSEWRPHNQGKEQQPSWGHQQEPGWGDREQQHGRRGEQQQQPGWGGREQQHGRPGEQQKQPGWGGKEQQHGRPGEQQQPGWGGRHGEREQPSHSGQRSKWDSGRTGRGEEQEAGSNIYTGFDDDILQQVFDVEYEIVRQLKGLSDDRGLIVQAENFQVLVPEEQEAFSPRTGSGIDNGIEETICSTKLRANIASPARADVYNPRGGRISRLNSYKLPVLESLQLSAEKGVLYKNALLAPHYNLNAHSIIYITSGSSRLQIVGNDGSAVFDGEVQEGQLIVVPQDFAVIKKAGEQGCEWVAFKTNDNAITTQLAGRFSFIRAVPDDVLVNSYNISPEEARNLKYSRQEGVVLSPRPRSSRSPLKKVQNAVLNALFG